MVVVQRNDNQGIFFSMSPASWGNRTAENGGIKTCSLSADQLKLHANTLIQRSLKKLDSNYVGEAMLKVH